jgi:IS5 family transposase
MMSRRDYSQKTFADILVEGRSRRRERLDRLGRIEGLLDWQRIDRLLDGINGEKRGGRGYPPLNMLKALLLAQWHDLSDPGLEDALADRLSFRRFCGWPLGEETPDETSFVRFRAKLRDLGLYEKLFAEVNRQLEAKGLMVKTGTLVDATVIEARATPPRRKEGEVSAVDPDAGFTKKHGRTYFGYKLHIGVDDGSELIRALTTSSADLHDGEAFGALVIGDEAKVYGDKAYGSQKNRDFLSRMGIADAFAPLSRTNGVRGLTVQGGAQQAPEILAGVVQQGGVRGPLRRRTGVRNRQDRLWSGQDALFRRSSGRGRLLHLRHRLQSAPGLEPGVTIRGGV